MRSELVEAPDPQSQGSSDTWDLRGRALAAEVPHVQPGSVQASIASITPDGIAVEVACCLNARSAADERADKTALMLGVLRLADRMRVRLGDGDSALPALGAAAD